MIPYLPQPLDADLAEIAALSTTAYGRSLLTIVDQAGLQTAVDAVVTSGTYSNPSWITALAYSKISGVPDFVTANSIPSNSPLFFDRLVNECPSSTTIPGVANYSGGNAELSGGITAGSTTFAITGSPTLADFGTGAWSAVLYDPVGNRYYPCLAVSRSGNNVTISPPSPVTIAAGKLYNRHDAILGQHQTLAGNKCLADLLYFSSPSVFTTSNPVVDVVSPLDGYRWNLSPMAWQPLAGMTQWQVDNSYGENISDAGNVAIRSQDLSIVRCDAQSDGQGCEITLRVNTSGCCTMKIGHQETNPNLVVRTQVYADTVLVDTIDSYGILTQISFAFPFCKDLKVKVTAVAAAMVIRIGDLVISPQSTSRKFLYPGEKLLIVGDSWTDSAAFPGLAARLDELHDATVTTVGVSGTEASYALAVVSGKTRIQTWIDTYAPNVCLIHYYINDVGAAVTKQVWASNIQKICKICLDNKVTPVVILPGATASIGQSQALQATYGHAFDPPRLQNLATDGLLNDLSNVITYVNKNRKVSGRIVTVAGVPYVATGSATTSNWIKLTDASTVTPS